ncbi:hypothetical protein LEMLEM_LOCUS14794 [Lemmus lemmus]
MVSHKPPKAHLWRRLLHSKPVVRRRAGSLEAPHGAVREHFLKKGTHMTMDVELFTGACWAHQGVHSYRQFPLPIMLTGKYYTQP